VTSLTSAPFLGPMMLLMGESWWFGGDTSAMGDSGWALIGVALIFTVFFWLLFETTRLTGPLLFSVHNYIATVTGIDWGM